MDKLIGQFSIYVDTEKDKDMLSALNILVKKYGGTFEIVNKEWVIVIDKIKLQYSFTKSKIENEYFFYLRDFKNEKTLQFQKSMVLLFKYYFKKKLWFAMYENYEWINNYEDIEEIIGSVAMCEFILFTDVQKITQKHVPDLYIK